MFASQGGHASVVTTLVEDGNADVNKADDYGWTALMFASQNGHAAIVTTKSKET